MSSRVQPGTVEWSRFASAHGSRWRARSKLAIVEENKTDHRRNGRDYASAKDTASGLAEAT